MIWVGQYEFNATECAGISIFLADLNGNLSSEILFHTMESARITKAVSDQSLSNSILCLLNNQDLFLVQAAVPFHR